MIIHTNYNMKIIWLFKKVFCFPLSLKNIYLNPIKQTNIFDSEKLEFAGRKENEQFWLQKFVNSENKANFCLFKSEEEEENEGDGNEA